MKVKVQQLLREHAHASILNGAPVQTFKPDSWWFQRWQEDYGLSLRQANRKYAVPRHVLKERLELFWVSLFRVRQLAVFVLGYEPMQLNFDQSPYHHNESGSQNKATLGVLYINATVTYCKCAVSVCKWAPLLATYPSESDKVGPISLQVCCPVHVLYHLYHQWSSVVISGHQCGHQWASVVIIGHQWASVGISGHQFGFALRVTYSDLHFA